MKFRLIKQSDHLWVGIKFKELPYLQIGIALQWLEESLRLRMMMMLRVTICATLLSTCPGWLEVIFSVDFIELPNTKIEKAISFVNTCKFIKSLTPFNSVEIKKGILIGLNHTRAFLKLKVLGARYGHWLSTMWVFEVIWCVVHRIFEFPKLCD